MVAIIEYMLCYSMAFILGVIFGVLLMYWVSRVLNYGKDEIL